MGYEDIRTALATKVMTAAPTSKVHEFWRFTLEPLASDEFGDLFLDNDRINVIIINRTSFQDIQGNEDNMVIRRHMISLSAHYSFQDSETLSAENNFNEILEDIEEEFRNGDRTLSGSVLCCSLLEFPPIDFGNLGNRKIPMLRCEIKVVVDEILTAE